MGYEDLLKAISKPSKRRCAECDRPFTPKRPGQENCPQHEEAVPDPANVGCSRCAQGRPEPAAWSGWMCSANRALQCQPGVLNALMESKEG